ncbi:hypothetical protein EDB84DRAFT_1492155 [Lactarius hengduanensis]|nr:hypothetical protein EDB84DRAFT_1492155 [Lactarius hengduanensis]
MGSVWRLARVTLGATLSVPGKTLLLHKNNYWPGQSLIPACQRAGGVRVRRLVLVSVLPRHDAVRPQYCTGSPRGT